MAKKGVIIGIVLGVLLISIGLGYYFATSSSTVTAQLHVEQSGVQVNGNEVLNNVHLSKGDVITTTDGKATIILYESVLVSLEPNSKVTLDELTKTHPKVSVQAGHTWNTFTKLAGVEGFSTSSGSTVASVRGTVFEFGDGFILTGEGTVEYNTGDKTFEVNTGRVVENGVERDATSDELAQAHDYLLRAIQELRYLRQLEIDKHPALLALAKQTYNVDETRINALLEESDNGQHDVDAFKASAPVHADSIDKVADITKAIQKLNQALNG